MQTRGTASRESLQMRPQYGPIFCAISTVIWLNLAETPPITKLPPGRKRPTLRYDYKRPTSPSRAIASATPFSRLRYDRDIHKTAVDFLEDNSVKLNRKLGVESEDARREREQQEEAIERAAGKLNLAPAVETAPRNCSSCGEPIPGEAKRYQILSVEQLSVGPTVSSVEWLKVLCEKCHGVAPVRSGGESSAVEDESWMDKLSASERQAYAIYLQDPSQTGEQIGRKMGMRQQHVSRLLRSVEGKRKEAQKQKLRATGGA